MRWSIRLKMIALLLLSSVGCSDNGNKNNIGKDTSRLSDITQQTNVAETTRSTAVAVELRSDQSPLEAFSSSTRRTATLVEQMANRFNGDADAMEVTARFYLLIGQHETAERYWEKALQISPNYAYALEGLGKLAMKRGDYDLADGCFKRAMIAAPESNNAVHSRADVLIKKGEVDQAIEILEAFVLSHPSSAITHLWVGQASLAKRDFKKSLGAFESVLKNEPNNHVAQQGLATSLIRLGRREEAKQWLDRYQQTRPSAPSISLEQTLKAEGIDLGKTLVEVASIYQKHGLFQESLDLLMQACASDQSSQVARKRAIDVANLLGRTSDGVELFLQLTRLAPDNRNYWRGLGRLCLKEERWKPAQQAIQRWIELDPDDPDAHMSMAEVYLRSNEDVGLAVKPSSLAVQLRGSASDFVTYAQSLLLSGDRIGAIEAMNIAIQKEPENTHFHQILRQLQGEGSNP
jgi:tetratricopeptide (TPR) repeat protein